MKLPNNPYMSLMCTEPFCAVCNSRVEYGTKKYKFGRMIIQAEGEFQIPCQAWVEKYVDPAFDGSREPVCGRGQLTAHSFL